jgi:hypothetical protein
MREWDPVGVADQPLARAECDTYAARIAARLLAEKTTEDHLGQFLIGVERDHKGMIADRADSAQRTARALFNLRESVIE